MEHETEWDNLPARSLARTVDAFLTAGNGIASALIGIFGPTDFTQWTSYAQAERECQKRLGKRWYEPYEMWQCWFTMMRERTRLRALLPADDAVQG